MKSLLSAIAIAMPLALLVLVQYRLWFDDTGVQASRSLVTQIDKLYLENRFHQEENNKLLAEVTELRQGTELLEEKAREELGLIKEGESFILFIEPNSNER